MLSPVEELKIQAKRLRKHYIATPVQPGSDRPSTLRHCQQAIARRYGFRDWQHAREILSCKPYTAGQDYGSLWYASSCAPLLNRWCRNYREALELQQHQEGILLPYKRQFLLADRHFLNALGLQYDDPLWAAIDHNWCQGPATSRQQIALKRLQQDRRRQAEPA